MFGSLMMLASGVVASAPSSASASGTRPNAARMRPDSEMSRVSTPTPAAAGERLDHGQERVRRQRRCLVGVRVDDLHLAAFSPRGPARKTRYLPPPTLRGDYPGVTPFPGVTLAKRKYFILKETGGGKLRVDFRSWPFVIVIGLVLAILSMIDRGGLGEAPPVAPRQHVLLHRRTAMRSTCAPAPRRRRRRCRSSSAGRPSWPPRPSTNGFRQMADGTWVSGQAVDPRSGQRLHLMGRWCRNRR